MAAKASSSGEGRETTPSDYPETPPPRYPSASYDFTLQAVMEMQRSIGDLAAKTDRLIADVKSQGEKIDSVRMKIAWVTGGAAVVGFLVAMLLAAARFLPYQPSP